MKTKISEITIIPVKPNKGLVALASCVIDDKLYLGSLGIYTLKPPKVGYRVTYPTKIIGRDRETDKVKSINIYHPINEETQVDIEKGIIEEYETLMEGSMSNYNEEED